MMEEMELSAGAMSFEICSECGQWALYVRECSGKLPLLLTEMKYCLCIASPLSFYQNRTHCKDEVTAERHVSRMSANS